ncbi:LysR family transcriptional regulator [Virgibacillus necropolis]|uniref:Transcriptional regulator n=1 Tax=Virgibacillus necropolis TaxID=163877 RepID=A0A221MA17_9BACI|nr:LysR family transcriptional regulator [Virgibacillus necropolis]ASN04496.1 transcriptional regulator [Virgibacillus necropolis]
MEIRHLRYFITVVEQETYTNAASMLHISQPSLSTTIKKLEIELGLTLMDRSTRESSLTKEGKILYQEAKKLINHFDHVSEEMTRLKQQGPLELSFGLIESSKSWVPKIIKEFKKEYNDVHIKIFDILSLDEVVKSLSNFDVHLAITNQYINNEEIETIPIYEENLVAILPPSHPLVAKNYIKISDLENEEFIVCKEGFQTREDILNAFRKSGVKPNIQFEIERFETACSMVEEGLGITVVPENYVKYSKKFPFHVKKIQDSNISRTVYLAIDKNRYLPPLVNRFIRLIRNFFDGDDT